ncbi:S8 family peptidase [Streptomyces smaragdinus]|nr:S8 family peptidase [Streptomyces smaragdinus]
MALTDRTRWRVTAALSAAATAVALALTAAAPGQAAPAEGRIIGAGNGADAVQDSYIVVLNEHSGLTAASAAGHGLVARYGGEITRTYRAALNGYAAHLTGTEARRLAADPAVARVFQDTTVHAQATQLNPPWNLDRIDQANPPLDGAYTYPDSAGRGVHAYIIDTGVRVTHQDFDGRASYGYDAVDGDTSAADGNGHGTHVAGIVAGKVHGVAKKAEIVSVRVLDDSGAGSTAGVLEGIDWVTANAVKPAVANLSLGAGASAVLDDAVRASIASGITYAVAAGGSNADASAFSPARVTEALTVGATDTADRRASSSNYGPVLDLFAPGVNITSTWNTSNTATATLSGTSVSSPHVAGAAAVYLGEHPASAPPDVAAALIAAASPVVQNPGPGSPDLLLRVTW